MTRILEGCTPVGGCWIRFLMRRPYCTLNRRRLGRKIIWRLISLSASCIFPLRHYASLYRKLAFLTDDLLIPVSLRPPAVMTDGWFLPVQAVSSPVFRNGLWVLCIPESPWIGGAKYSAIPYFSTLPYPISLSSKATAGFGQAVVKILADCGIIWDDATQVILREVFDCAAVCYISTYLRSTVGFSWRGLTQHFSFLKADGAAECLSCI